jgi:hypothetical protein
VTLSEAMTASLCAGTAPLLLVGVAGIAVGAWVEHWSHEPHTVPLDFTKHWLDE